ncbi:MAG: penicillin-binding protein 1A [Bernardetiaceae bacterium]
MLVQLIRLCWVAFSAVVLILFLWVFGVMDNYFGWFGGMPDLQELENPRTELASEIRSADGELLGKYFYQNRTPVGIDEISPNMIHALLATEDIRFYEHSGIDLISTGRVIKGLLTLNRQGGGSTISQQLAKNLFRTREVRFEGSLVRTEAGEPRGKLKSALRMLIIKTKEWIMAIRIERTFTKDEIITLYLNTVDFGRNNFGIQVAAQKYFGTTPRELSVDQAAVLAGMLKAPTRYNPFTNPENSIQRRNVVLAQMKKYGYLDQNAYDSLRLADLGAIDDDGQIANEHNEGLATYFRTVLQNYLVKWGRENGYDIFADGLIIHTTIDSRMQAHAERAMQDHMKKIQELFIEHLRGRKPWIDKNYQVIPDYLERVSRQTPRYRQLKRLYGADMRRINQVMTQKVPMRVFDWKSPGYEKDTVMSPMDSISYYKHFMHFGMLAMEPQTGHVKAWVGGINHKYFKFDNVTSARQPGSTFKPIVYGTAIAEREFHPCFEVVDAPVTIQLETGETWTPKNSDGYSGQTFTLRQAMARSINTIAGYLMREIGPQRVVKYAQDMGIESRLDPVPSLCLGTSDVSVKELVGAYGTYVNLGTWREPIFITKITDRDGKVIQDFYPKTREVFSEQNAAIMLHMLRGSLQERNGTALALNRYQFVQGNEVGGKTGTTQNNMDGWFVGLTKNLVVGVRVGGEDTSIHFRTTALGQGARAAMPAYGMFMDLIFADPELNYQKGTFKRPAQEISVELDCQKYKLPTQGDEFLQLLDRNSAAEDAM